MMAQSQRQLRGRHVLALALAFFAVVFAVNAVFIYLALDSFRGLSTDDAYVRGLDYNRTIAAAQAQQVLGWQARLESERVTGSNEVVLRLTIVDRDGAPIPGLSADGMLQRPVDDSMDRRLVFAAAGDGRYEARALVPQWGQWDVRLTARAPGGESYRLEQRLWLK